MDGLDSLIHQIYRTNKSTIITRQRKQGNIDAEEHVDLTSQLRPETNPIQKDELSAQDPVDSVSEKYTSSLLQIRSNLILILQLTES